MMIKVGWFGFSLNANMTRPSLTSSKHGCRTLTPQFSDTRLHFTLGYQCKVLGNQSTRFGEINVRFWKVLLSFIWFRGGAQTDCSCQQFDPDFFKFHFRSELFLTTEPATIPDSAMTGMKERERLCNLRDKAPFILVIKKVRVLFSRYRANNTTP